MKSWRKLCFEIVLTMSYSSLIAPTIGMIHKLGPVYLDFDGKTVTTLS
jgi:hypothetical protein